MNRGSTKHILLATVLVALLLAVPASLIMEQSDSTELDFTDDYYYNQLTLKEKTLYRQIYSATLNFEPEIETGYPDLTLKELGMDALNAVRYDHPELFYLISSYKYDSSGTMYMKYTITKGQFASINASIESKAEEMLHGLVLSDRALAIAWINEKIVSWSSYDVESAKSDDRDDAHSIKGIFVDGKAVCEGYALAFKYLCDIIGIPCICVVGDGSDDGEEWVGHMWNQVMIGDEWYAMDVTWNDPLVNGKDSGRVFTTYTLVGASTKDNGVRFDESHIIGKLSLTLGVPEIEAERFGIRHGTDSPAYYSTEPYYFSKLTDEGKKAYIAIVEGALNFEENIKTGVKGNINALFDAVRAVKYDRQDLFQIPREYSCNSGTGEVNFEYPFTKERYERMCDEIAIAMGSLNEYLKDCSGTYDTVLGIHDYLVSNMAYASGSSHAWDIYGALVEKRGVCESYSRAFQYVCSLYGINAICVSGIGYNSAGSENHMWNMVLMNDGKWYDMDVTWDDPLVNGMDSGDVRHTYFLVGSETKNNDGRKFSESHVPAMGNAEDKTEVFTNAILPEASAKDYYIRPGQTVEIVLDVESVGSNGIYRTTVTLEDLEKGAEAAQGVGNVMVPFGNGSRLGMSSSDVNLFIHYMKSNLVDEITFVSEKTTGNVSVGPVSLQNDVFSFRMLSGTEEIAPKDISNGFKVILSLPFDASGMDIITPLIFAWNSSNALMPVFSSTFSDGHVELSVDNLDDSFAVGSTPVKGVPVIFVIAAILLLIIILLAISKHHKHKKAKT